MIIIIICCVVVGRKDNDIILFHLGETTANGLLIIELVPRFVCPTGRRSSVVRTRLNTMNDNNDDNNDDNDVLDVPPGEW